jgi:sucrose-6-phosphatase
MDDFNFGYNKALDVMRANATHDGFSASTEKHVNYFSIWARDHSICALAALLTKDKNLIQTAKAGILHLLQHQSDAGQIPSYIEIENKKKVYGGLGSITSVDSNLWVLIAAATIYRETGDKRFLSSIQMKRYKLIYRLIRAFDSNNCGLMEVHIAGDWADVMHRSYHVLYDECLHYQAFKSLEYLYGEYLLHGTDEVLKVKLKKNIGWIIKRRKLIRPQINDLFWLTPQNIEKIKEQYMIYSTSFDFLPFYQSHMTPFEHTWSKRFDSFGNILAMLTPIAPKERALSIISYVQSQHITKPTPLTALYPPIMPHDTDWEVIYEVKETPFTYHNGGIWPMITGFWIAALVKHGKLKFAREQMCDFTESMAQNHWIFPEYLHGQSLVPMGRMNQAWSAAGYIIAYFALQDKMPF